MFKNLSFFKRIAGVLRVSLSILAILKGNSNTSFFLPITPFFFDNEVYTFLVSLGIEGIEGTFNSIPISTPLTKTGFNFSSSS